MTRTRFALAWLAAGPLMVGVGPAAALRAQAVAEVQITPETMTLGVAQRQPLFAAAYDRRGNLLTSARFSFWSSDTLVARVVKNGQVIGVRPGLARVEVRAQGRRASMAVLITGGVPPDSLAGAADSAGAASPPAPVEPGPEASDTAPATARAPAHPTIAAIEVSPARKSDPIEVPLDGTRRFAVTAQAADSAPIPGVQIAWEVADTAVARFDPSEGTLRARAPGHTTLTARVPGFAPVVWAIRVTSEPEPSEADPTEPDSSEAEPTDRAPTDSAGPPIEAPPSVEQPAGSPR